jgi:hypothetical protein
MPFGLGTIGENGCGVIATYNAMITLGDCRSYEEIYDYYTSDLSRTVFLGFMGTAPWAVEEYFRSQGYTVRTTDRHDEIDIYSAMADACILLYIFDYNGYGGHYVEYSRMESKYSGRNTSESSGAHTFLYPSDYGVEGSRIYTVGIFIFKTEG